MPVAAPLLQSSSSRRSWGLRRITLRLSPDGDSAGSLYVHDRPQLMQAHSSKTRCCFIAAECARRRLAGALVVLHCPHDNVHRKSTIAVTITKWSSFLTLPAMCNSSSGLAVSFESPRTSQGQLPYPPDWLGWHVFLDLAIHPGLASGRLHATLHLQISIEIAMQVGLASPPCVH